MTRLTIQHRRMCDDAESYQKTLRAMTKFTASYISAVYGALNEAEGELVGSGFFLEVDENPWLLSAKHVLDHKAMLVNGQKKFLTLACSKDDGHSPFPLREPFYGQGFPVDVGATPLPGWTSASRLPASPDQLAEHSENVGSTMLFFQGFPQKKSISLSVGVASKAVAYLSGLGELPPESNLDSNVHFAIDYSGDCLRDEQGRPIDLIEAKGFSGSAVWAVNGGAHIEGWAPDQARIVGVLIEVGEKHRALVATRIEHVRMLLLEGERRWKEDK